MAPTILALLGEPIPGYMTGQPFAGVTSSFRVDPGGEVYAGTHSRNFEYTPEEQAIIEQRLADLGYLE